MSDDVVVAGLCRTPFGRFDGALRELRHDRLGALAVDMLLAKTEVAADSVGGVLVGVGMIAAGVLTPARRIVLESSLPDTTPSLTVDRACCSGMTAVGLAAREIASGDAELMIAGGVESLSTIPRLAPRTQAARPGTVDLSDPLLLRAPFGDIGISVYSGEEALANGIGRTEQDEWALGSHQRYFDADARGDFAFERSPIAYSEGGRHIVLEADEAPRSDTTLEKLASLRTVYGGPTVTAGNAPGLNDGAAFLLLASRRAAEELGLPVLARIIGYAQVAGQKTSGTWTPAVAIRRVLDRHDMQLGRIGAIEINEAYAATPLVSIRKLAGEDRTEAERLRTITNVNGGAVAIGHPLGASGARIIMSLINVTRNRGGGFGVAAICGGYGQGDAVLIEVEP